MSRCILFTFLGLFVLKLSHFGERRIGKLYHESWESYFALGANDYPHSPSESTPDFSPVGVLLSRSGTVGSGTLIAPNVLVTAAHVLRNSFADEVNPADWEFLLGSNEDWTTSEGKNKVKHILLHPGWTARQNRYNRFGDGDELGVDVALVFLDQPIDGVFPARIPESNDDPLGKRAVLAGYGTLVEGINGKRLESNQRRVGGENIFDRSVAKVVKEGVPDSYLGGLLAIDFDSSSSVHNTLGEGKKGLELLGEGQSDLAPLPLEATTAYGDSGGPAFARTQNEWRVHGVVSYGTKNSRYGDVTVFTRLSSHYDWIMENSPSWPSARTIGYKDWRESSWWGIFLPKINDWYYHISLGWVFIPAPSGDSFWAWHISLGWIWFSSQVHPFLYEQKTSNWYYLSTEQSVGGRILLYNYALEVWEYVHAD